MKNPSRRQFLISSGAGLALSAFAPCFGAGGARRPPWKRTDRSLLILQLSGGNDGLSMVVPYADDRYGQLRSRTRIAESEVIKLDDYCGLHPALTGLKSLYDRGMLAIVPGAGYPEPNRSHFKSLDIWHAADLRGRNRGSGWLGRLCALQGGDSADSTLAIHVGSRPPYALQSRTYSPLAFTTPLSYKWVGLPRESDALLAAAPVCEHESAPSEAAASGRDRALRELREVLVDAKKTSADVRAAAARFAPKTTWPASPLAAGLATVCALHVSDLGTRVYSLDFGGFDTHSNQRPRHDNLMRTLDAALSAFVAELDALGLLDSLAVVVFSEFGRRVEENGSGGTDHGAAGPMLVLGSRVHGGLRARHPSLSDLDRGDIIHTIDFRQVYGAAIDQWLQGDHRPILGEWKPPALFKT